MSELNYPEDIRLKIEEQIGFDPREITPPFGYRVMLKIFTAEEHARLPDGTKSSIIRADTTKDNDKFINCVGMIISMNPKCYTDERYKDMGRLPKLGDWVVYPRGNSTQVVYKGNHVAYIFEDMILQAIEAPEFVSRA